MEINDLIITRALLSFNACHIVAINRANFVNMIINDKMSSHDIFSFFRDLLDQ